MHQQTRAYHTRARQFATRLHRTDRCLEPAGDPMPALVAAYEQLTTTSFRWET